MFELLDEPEFRDFADVGLVCSVSHGRRRTWKDHRLGATARDADTLRC